MIINNTLLLSLTLITFSSHIASAQTKDGHLVKITGELKPETLITANQQDLLRIEQEIQKIDNMEVIEVDINQLYSKEEYPAFDAVKKEINRIISESARLLADMRKTVYELDIDLQLSPNQYAQLINTQEYQRKYQNQFTQFLKLFLGSGSIVGGVGYNVAISNAMKLCKTTRCVNDLHTTQVDLLDFGMKLNQRIELSSMKKWEMIHPIFKTLTIKDAVNAMLNSLVAPNQARPVHSQIIRLIAVPAVAAIAATDQAVKNTVQYLNPNSYLLTKFEFYADSIKLSTKQQEKIMDGLNLDFKNNLSRVLGNPIIVVKEEGDQGEKTPKESYLKEIQNVGPPVFGPGLSTMNVNDQYSYPLISGQAHWIADPHFKDGYGNDFLKSGAIVAMDSEINATLVNEKGVAPNISDYTLNILTGFHTGYEGNQGLAGFVGPSGRLKAGYGKGVIQSAAAGGEIGVLMRGKKVIGMLSGAVFFGGSNCVVEDEHHQYRIQASNSGAVIGRLYVSDKVILNVMYAQSNAFEAGTIINDDHQYSKVRKGTLPNSDVQFFRNTATEVRQIEGSMLVNLGKKIAITGSCSIMNTTFEQENGIVNKPEALVQDGTYDIRLTNFKIGLIRRIY